MNTEYGSISSFTVWIVRSHFLNGKIWGIKQFLIEFGWACFSGSCMLNWLLLFDAHICRTSFRRFAPIPNWIMRTTSYIRPMCRISVWCRSVRIDARCHWGPRKLILKRQIGTHRLDIARYAIFCVWMTHVHTYICFVLCSSLSTDSYSSRYK